MKKNIIVVFGVVFISAAFFGGCYAVGWIYMQTPRSKGLRCNNNFRQIESAKDYYAQQNGLSNGSIVTLEQIDPYVHPQGSDRKYDCFKCPAGGTYKINPVGHNPTCSLGDPTAKGEKNWWHRLP